MTYKAIYRTYRPMTFDEVVGQNHIVTTLKNAIKENKIAHAYLFCGPRGTGKTSIAKILAKAVNCKEDNPPCGTCDNCKSIAEGFNPDVVEIDAASNRGVGEVRDLIDRVKYAPISGKYKVYIIDEVHMMTTEAFNALLKTLEEPPAHAIFILATTEPQKLLATIISRCQRFDFKKVEDKDLVSRMEYILKQENKEYEIEALDIIARLADGGVRDSLSILEQCLAYDKKVTVESVNGIYGLLSVEKKIDFIKTLLKKDIAKALKDIEEMLNSSVDVKKLTFDLIDVLKDIVIYKNTNNSEDLLVLSSNNIKSIAPYITGKEALEIIDLLIEASSSYSLSLNANMYFELAILKICNKDFSIEKINLEENETSNQIVEVKEETVTLKEDVIEEDYYDEVSEAIEGGYDESLDEISTEEIIEETKEEIVHVEVDEDNIINEEPIQNEEPVVHVYEEPIEETIEEEIIEDVKTEIKFEDILNILVQADRSILDNIKEKWPIIRRYRLNVNTAKQASLLSDGTPVAACKGGLIIGFEHEPQMNEANYSNNYKKLKQLLKEVLGEDVDYIAIKKEAFPAIRHAFIEMKQKGTLPKAKPIVLHHINQESYKDTLSDAQRDAIEMFGEDIVEIE